MDVLTCMEGERRFYVNGPIAKDLEYTVTVEGVGSGILRRQVYGENVRRVEVGGGGKAGEVEVGRGGKAGEVQGTLFIPERPGPGVLCMKGVAGVAVSFRDNKHIMLCAKALWLCMSFNHMCSSRMLRHL